MENVNIQESHETREKMIRGSAWMSIGSIVSRMMGAVYIIPWYLWMGEDGNLANSLFGKGYNIYALFLMIATAGIPGAVAKQISHYNSQNAYHISQKLFEKTVKLMLLLGLFFAVLLYLLSPALASWSGGDEGLVRVIRSLCWAVLIFPSMSVFRGYFQGFHNMAPSAMSQMIEQFARVFYMLLTAYIIMQVQQGNYVDAVVHSTFAAFIGMLASFVVLLFYLKKQNALVAEKIKSQRVVRSSDINTKLLIKDVLKEAVPFIVIGSGVTLFKLVDQFSFTHIMKQITDFTNDEIDSLFAIFNLNVDKLTMIVISFATSISFTSLPLVTEAYTKKDKEGLSKLITDNLQLFMFVMIPATLGLIALATPLYTLFYAYSSLGSRVLIEASIAGFFIGLFMLLSFILQGLYQNKEAMIYLTIGLLVKLIFQYPCTVFFGVYGPLLATMLGFAVTCYWMIGQIYYITRFNYQLVLRRSVLMFILGLIMMLGVAITRFLLQLIWQPVTKGASFWLVLFSVTIGIMIYGYLVLKLRLADRLLGPKVSRLRTKFHIK